MKKYVVVILSLVLVLSLVLTGCSKSEDADAAKEPEKDTEEATEASQEKQGMAGVGLGILTNVKKSKDAGEEDGLAQTNSLVAAVLVDGEGKIAKAVIDEVQVMVNFDKMGKIKTPLDTMFASKNVLKEDYGMKKSSGIGKEWNEQADFFAEYIQGKTLEEVKGIALAEGVPADEDLKAGVTIHVADFIAVVEKAMMNVKPGAMADDMLGLGVSASIARSKDAAEEDGMVEAYIYYVASTFNADNKITSTVVDATQANVNFSKEGKITSDITAPVMSKNELGDEYGMKKASEIGKEWYEQAAAFADYTVGKTVEEVKGIALEEGGKPADEDLKASVTIHVTEIQETLEKAFEMKK